MHPAGEERGENGRERAVSELIGAILLVSLVILAMAIVAVMVLSQPPPEKVPHLNALAGNSTEAIYLYHNGGDTLKEAETVIRINNDPAPVDHSLIRVKNEDGMIEQDSWSITKTPWSVGKTLIIGQDSPPGSVALVHQGPVSQSLILKASFTPEIIGPPVPVTTSPTATPTATATTTITTTVTTTIPTTNVTTPVTTSPTPTPTPACGTISGTKYNDLNGNGQRDPGEPVLSGWTLHCYNKQSGVWILIQSATTDAAGHYIFSGLQYSQHADDYQVREVIQPGWTAVNPPNGISSSYTLNQPHCYENNVDFGNRQVQAPVAGFTGSPRTGTAPLQVQFADTSTGDPTQWQWDFNNDGTVDSTVQNPSFTYTNPGTYSVKFTVTNAGGADTMIRSGYITVTAPPSNDVYLVADKQGALQSGNYIQFEVAGPYSEIEFGNTNYNLAEGDIVRLTITSDGSGELYATDTYISDFSFGSVTFTLNGVNQGTKDVRSIWISEYDLFESTLTLIVPSRNNWTRLLVDGIMIINGNDDQEIRIFSLRTNSYGVMNLNSKGNIYYNGGATGYQLS